MQLDDISKTLEDQIPLDKPAIGLAFVEDRPDEIERTGTVVPSSCAFWYEAETDVFYAAAEDHYNCPLGAMVMGFPLGEDQMRQLMQEVGMMCESSYVREEEVPNVPKVDKPSSGIVYGPLSRLPVNPDVVLLWVNPMQAMVVGESAGLINWAAGPAGVYGRPGCAAIPVAIAGGTVSQSLGCVGMRINSGISDEYMLMAVPQKRLAPLAEALERVSETHMLMETHYNQKAAALDA